MSRTAIALSDGSAAAAADADIQAASKRLDSGRSLGSDDTASTDPSSTGTCDDQYDPYNKSSSASSSGKTSRVAGNPWAPKTARNASASTKSSSSTPSKTTMTTTATRLRRSRSDEDLQLLETFVQKAEKEHGLAPAQGGGRNTSNRNSTTTTAGGDTTFDDDLQAMMDGVEERRRARGDAEANNGSFSTSRGRPTSRRDGKEKMARRRSNSAPPSASGSNRSLFTDDDTDDEDTIHSDGDYRKTIRWTDHHGESLEDVCVLDPAMSEGGMRRADKLRGLYGCDDDDDYLDEDEEVQYDSDETPTSDEDGDDYYGDDDGNDQHAEVSMIFDTQFLESEDVDLNNADASLSLVDAVAALPSPSSERNVDRASSNDGSNKGGAGRRSRRPQVHEGSFTLDDLTDVQAIATSVMDGGEPDAGASASCFGEVSMDLSEISAEMNDELNELQPPAPNRQKKAMPSIMEDSMNVFPDPELVTSKDKAINASVGARDRSRIPVPTSVVVGGDALLGTAGVQTVARPNGAMAQPLPPARKKRSSFTISPTSSPNAAKIILATKPIDVLDGGNDSFADFANWGNDSFDANTSTGYKTNKKEQHQHHPKHDREHRSNPAPSSTPSASTSARPSRSNRSPGNNSTRPAGTTTGGRPRKGAPPGRQPRPPGSKGPAPPSRQLPQQRQQQGRRPASDIREKPRRSSSTNSDTARKAAAAVPATSSANRSKGKSMLGGLFTRNSQTSKQSKKLDDDEVGILGHVDSSLGDSLTSLGELAGLDSYFDPPSSASRAGGGPNTGNNLAASIARNSQRQQQQRRRNNMKGRSLDDSDAALFAHINDGQQNRQSRRDSLDDMFVKDKW